MLPDSAAAAATTMAGATPGTPDVPGKTPVSELTPAGRIARRWPEGERTPVVLIVEDEPAARRLLVDVVRDEGADVVEAGDGAEAVAAIRRRRPDLILLDLMMPGIDGWRFLELYRQLPGPHAPVVVVTAAPPPARSTVMHDVEDVVPKPFSVDHLLDVVSRHLGQ